jgi:hypothetical protein
MANTYTLISSVTVGSGGAANIEFTSIPATYTDLVVKASLRQATASTAQLGLRFNSDTGNNYSRRSVYADGSSAYSGSGSSENYMRIARIETSTYTASTFGNYELYIPNYAGSNNKSVSTDGVVENNASTADGQSLFAGLWSSSAAITSLMLSDFGDATNFAQYSTAYLYGISNA